MIVLTKLLSEKRPKYKFWVEISSPYHYIIAIMTLHLVSDLSVVFPG